MNRKLKTSEYDLFDKLSQEWWDEEGKFKVLHQIRPIRIKYILSQLKKNKINNLDVLDVGCGGGLITESLTRLGANVTGIDFVENNIKVAKLHASNKKLKINYIQGDIEKQALNKKYDLIIIFEVLEHLNNWKKFLSRIRNYIKKDGIVIISTINRNIISKYTAIFLAENILRWIPKGTHKYEKFIKPNEIKVIMEKNKFTTHDFTGLVFDPLSNNWKLSKIKTINYFCSFKS